ncbi:adenosylmethionine--8-amino-7-oxononanoate transaminase [Chlamydiota bacterium]
MIDTISKNELEKWDKEFIWHPFTQMKDWINDDISIIEKGEGVYLYDTHGRRYIDGISSLWVNVHGHRHPTINNAIKDQLDKISHSTLLGLSNVPSILLAKKLVEITPSSLKKVFFSDNGSTAVEVALKMAYQACQQRGLKKKKYFISFENAYHGDTIGSVSVGGMDLFHKIYKPFLFNVLRCPAPYCYHCDNKIIVPHCAYNCLQKVSSILAEKADEIIGVIVEPMIQCAAGMLTQPSGFMTELKSLCERYSVMLLVDEVATGFGRTGNMFACNHENIDPDILVLAKGLTGGYLPIAATLTSQEIYDAFYGDYNEQKTFFHGHTYTGNPLGCVAAIKSLELFEKEKTLEKLQPKIACTEEALQPFYELAHVGDIRQCGFMVGIELVKDKERRIPYNWDEKIGIKVIQEARKRGVIIRPLGNVIVMMPPLVITLSQLEELLNVIYESIKTVTEGS